MLLQPDPQEPRLKPLAETIDAHAARMPDALAFAAGADVLTWRAYAARSDALAAALVRAGVARGERVAVLLPDGPGVHVAFIATEKAGLVAVGIGPRAGEAEIRHLVARSGAVALVSRARHRDLDARALAERLRADGAPLRHHLVDEDDFARLAAPGERERRALAERRLGVGDLFLLNSTSGTTGLPKCVQHDQARWHHFHRLAVDAAELTARDVFLSALPAPFGFGIWTAHVTPALLGAPCVVLPQFDAVELCAVIARHRVTVMAAVSTQFILMLDALERAPESDVSSLRVLFTGGEAVPYARAAAFEERTGALVLQFYGSNETGALSCTTLRDSRDVRLRTAGHVIPEMQVRLFDAERRDVTATGRGQPGCRGPVMSAGYWDDAAANAQLFTADGWMLTGDLAEIDANGVLRVVGRTADIIIRGGKNISAPVVEAAVMSHPAVALAAAVPVPDPVFGERVCAVVELHPDAALTLDALVAHLRAQGVSVESWPERLLVFDELPRSSGGKIAKGALREEAARRLTTPREET
ncbi:MAG TPA: class I adenylate-forming enzyme family protein [Myxococcota bacterium]|nr:class I adenylate-forming enzyme family protein [Myxococcota bacterium]